MKILLNDILKINNLENVKIRFNKGNENYDPIRFFKEDKQRLLNGQFWNYSKSKSFKVGQIAIGFAKIEDDKWLLFDVSRITKDLEIFKAPGFEYETIKEYEKYFGRLIISYHNTTQNLIRKAEGLIDQCVVTQILEDAFDNDIFPGYENVLLSWYDLKRVLNKNVWKTALENQKGIYLIVDQNNGKKYVGSGSGERMLLQRWSDYVKNGHGGNKELKKLSFDYIKNNFRYSILDIYKSTTDREVIIKRESWWKNILMSSKYGYNDN